MNAARSDQEEPTYNRAQWIAGGVIVAAMAALIAAGGASACDSLQASQNWREAWSLGCPFTDDQGNHLYTWEPMP